MAKKSNATSILIGKGAQQYTGNPIWFNTVNRFGEQTNVLTDDFNPKSDFMYIDCSDLESKPEVELEFDEIMKAHGNFEYGISKPREYSDKSEKSGTYIKIYPKR